MMMPLACGRPVGGTDWEDGGEDIRIDNMSLLWRDPGANRCVFGEVRTLESRDDNAPDGMPEIQGRLDAPVSSRGDQMIASRDEMALMLCES